jgi:hypothetical protein
MTFRRDGQKSHSWRRWLLKNEAALERCGLPEFILKDKLSWQNFLAKGEWWYVDNRNRFHFHVEELSETRQQELYAFLETELTADEKLYSHAFRLLQSRLNKTP